MEQESELQRLEKFVEKILTRFSAIKAEKAQLEQEVIDRDRIIEELRESISSKVSERNEISERVNKIVDQIEEWELSLDVPEETAGDEKADSAVGQEETISEEDEKRVQHHLFSMTSSK